MNRHKFLKIKPRPKHEFCPACGNVLTVGLMESKVCKECIKKEEEEKTRQRRREFWNEAWVSEPIYVGQMPTRTDLQVRNE